MAEKTNSQKIDLLITGALVLTIDKSRSVFSDGYIAVKNGAIAGLGEGAPPETAAEKIIDARGKLAMPGLVNTHTHAAMTLLRGFADDLLLKEWLEKHIWPAEAKFMNKETVRLGARLAILEMVRSGTTTFNDMYFFEEEAIKAAKEIGIRMVAGEGLLGFPTPSHKTPEECLAYTEKLAADWQGDSLISVAVAPHATHTCPEKYLLAAKEIADKYNLPLHIHLAETEDEVEAIKKTAGMSPVRYLDKLGVLDEKTVAAHCVHLSEEDIAILKKRNCGVAHNPESNMKLASGAAPLKSLLEAGIKTGLGTDSAASNNDLDMFSEMDMAAKMHKVTGRDPVFPGAPVLAEMAAIGGAEVLGLDKKIGSLEKGKRADIILIDLNKPHLTPLYNPYSQIVYAARGSDVATVIIDGKIVMEDNKIAVADEEEIMREARLTAEKIKGK